jgi:hypothetical protein
MRVYWFSNLDLFFELILIPDNWQILLILILFDIYLTLYQLFWELLLFNNIFFLLKYEILNFVCDKFWYLVIEMVFFRLK